MIVNFARLQGLFGRCLNRIRFYDALKRYVYAGRHLSQLVTIKQYSNAHWKRFEHLLMPKSPNNTFHSRGDSKEFTALFFSPFFFLLLLYFWFLIFYSLKRKTLISPTKEDFPFSPIPALKSPCFIFSVQLSKSL